MKKLLSVLLMAVMLVVPCVAQDKTPDAPQPQVQSVAPEKSHNFFWNKINTPVLFVQAGGAFWLAREINGNASMFTTPSQWHRYLPNAYRESFAIMAAGDGIGYGFHKAHFKGHKWAERGVMWGTAGALYITANRYLKAYNKSDCDAGLTSFCH